MGLGQSLEADFHREVAPGDHVCETRDRAHVGAIRAPCGGAWVTLTWISA